MNDISILAIDPGSKYMGWVHMLNDTILLPGTLTMSSTAEFSTSIDVQVYYFIRMQLEGVSLSSGITIRPRYMVLEQFFSPRRQRGGNVIPELRGVIKLAANQLRVKIIEVAPLTVKKFISGSGKADKNEIRAIISEKYDISIKDTNLSDAIAIGLTGLDIVRRSISDNN